MGIYDFGVRTIKKLLGSGAQARRQPVNVSARPRSKTTPESQLWTGKNCPGNKHTLSAVASCGGHVASICLVGALLVLLLAWLGPNLAAFAASAAYVGLLYQGRAATDQQLPSIGLAVVMTVSVWLASRPCVVSIHTDVVSPASTTLAMYIVMLKTFEAVFRLLTRKPRRKTRGLYAEQSIADRALGIHRLADGYCYLALFRSERREAIARLLGAYPRARQVLCCKTDFCIAEVSGNNLVSHVQSGRARRGQDHALLEMARRGVRLGGSYGCPYCSAVCAHDDSGVLTDTGACAAKGCEYVSVLPNGEAAHDILHTRPRIEEIHGGAELCRCMWCEDSQARLETFEIVRHRTGRRSNIIGPMPQFTHSEHKSGQGARFDEYVNRTIAFALDYMWRPELTEGGLRNPENLTLHALDGRVFESARGSGEHTGDPEMAQWFAIAEARFRVAAAYWQPNDLVVVTANDSAECETTRREPSDIVPGATRGLVFCFGHATAGTLGDAWDVVYLPRTVSPRALAGVRLLPAITGRHDVNFVVVNGVAYNWNATRHVPSLLRAAVGYCSIDTAFSVTNLGCWYAAGAVFSADAEIIRKSFAEYGHVYGWDEAVLYERAPVTWCTGESVDDWCALSLKPGVVYENVTVLNRWSEADDFHAWHYPSLTIATVARLKSKNFESTTLTPLPTINSPWLPLDEVERRRDEETSALGIAPLQWGLDAVRWPRAGYRWLRVASRRNADPSWWGVDLPGAIWRATEAAWGLRSRLAPQVTQGLSPELWSAIDAQTDCDADLYDFYDRVAKRVADWEADAPEGVIAVVSVYNEREAHAFKEAYKFATAFVFFNEGEHESKPDELWIQLPVVYGTGFNFQLARLLPGLYSRHSRVFTVGNDLVTDWVPRATRLEVGLAALKWCNACFPAMDLNSPCPFQDVVYRGDAFANGAESLIMTIVNYGWVYGVDEIWANKAGFPTVAVRDTYGGAAHDLKCNPEPALLWRLTPEGDVVETLCPGGNFKLEGLATTIVRDESWWEHLVYGTSAGGETSYEAAASSRFHEMEWSEYETSGLHAVSWLSACGVPVAVWYTYGTRGDRIPVRAAAKAACEQTGVTTYVVHLIALEHGARNLALCEAGRSYEFLGDLAIAGFRARRRGSEYVVVPDYLYSDVGTLAYSLRARESDATAPGGGMPVWIDWLVSVIFWRDRARLRIGSYKGLKWFPRSADGDAFFVHKPVDLSRPERRVVVLGSSSVPVPEEYADWEVLPSGDHLELAKDVTVAVTNGSVGTVSTLKSGCGVRDVITYNSAIDRKWRTPQSAAQTMDGNEPSTKYRWVYGWFAMRHMPVSRAARSPIDFCLFLIWRVNVAQVMTRAWTLLFVAYSLRKTHVLPTVESTILVAARVLPSGKIARALTLLIAPKLMRTYLDYANTSYIAFIYSVTRSFVVGLFQPVTHVMVGYGYHPVTAALCGFLTSRLTLPRDLAGAQFRPHLSRQGAGVWLCMTPVYVWGVPLGMHSAYYDCATGTVLEGSATTMNNSMGAPFRFVRRQAPAYVPLIAFKSALTSVDLDDVNDLPAPYSAVWNCQTMLVGLYFRRGHVILGAEVLALLFFSSYAAVALLITTILASFMCFGSLVALAAAGPIDRAFPGAQLTRRVRTWNRLSSGALRWFGSEVTESELRDAAAIIAADAIKAGADETMVFEVLQDAVVAAAYAAESERAPSDEIILALLSTSRGPSDHSKTTLAAYVDHVLTRNADWLLRAGIPIRHLEAVSAITGALIDTFESSIGEALILAAWVLDYLVDKGAWIDLAGLTGAVASALDNASSTRTDRRKNVWALLGKKNIEGLRRPDWLALALKRSSPTVPATAAVRYIVDALNAAHPTGEKLPVDDVYCHPSFLPRAPRASEQEYTYPSLLQSMHTQIDPEQTKRIEKYLKLGGKVGLDGMWTATDDMRERVTSRYFEEPHVAPPEVEALVGDVCEVLYDNHTDAFEAPGVVLPETVKRKLNMKGRTGVPFVNKVKARKDLEKSGWMSAIISATYNILDTGEYPPDVYTEFAKMMVLDADKMVARGPRTIMATCMLTTFVNGVFELERRSRPIWATASTGIGAPLTAAYLGAAFAKVSERKQTFGADVTAFDSAIPPIIFEILSRLGEMGAQKSDFPEVGVALRNKYIRLQNALIVDLPTGRVWTKVRGGGTGQSATSWDNTWAMRACMIVIWTLASGKPASEFYKYNTVHNTGDDNIWGTDTDVDPKEFARVAKEALGLELRIESLGDLGGLSYLSKNAVPGDVYAAEILRVRDTVPAITAVHDRARLLTRRGAVMSRFSGMPWQAYKRALAERSVGQALLTWHQRDLYNMFAHEWMHDIRAYIGAKSHAVLFELERDEQGNLESVVPRFVKDYKPSRTEAARLKEALTGTLKYPRYLRVLESAYNEKQAPLGLSKYHSAKQKPSLSAAMREWVIGTRLRVNAWLPDSLVKLAPSIDAAPYSTAFYVWGFPLEKFVWRHMMAENPDFTLSEFSSAVRNAPYSVAASTTKFWWFIERPGVRETLLAEDMAMVRGRMYIATMLYMAFSRVIQWARASAIGVIVELFIVYQQDMPRLFSMMNTAHWLETAKSSPVISSLMPRDPYATQKRAAVTASLLAPDSLVRLVGAVDTHGIMSTVAEAIVRFKTWRIARGLDEAGKAPHENRWLDFVHDILQTAETTAAGAIVSAETSTGKSTELIAALFKKQPGRIWLLVHTRVLRDTYRNPWLAPDDVTTLARGSTDTGAKVAVMTYGHYIARMHGGVGSSPGDIVILDEFHLRLPVQAISYNLAQSKATILMLSATPDALFAPDAAFIKIPIPREFDLPTPRRLDLDVMQQFLLMKEEDAAGAQRVLFIMPTLRSVDATVAALVSMGEIATPLTSARRNVPKTGHIVATSVADTGINIVPAPTGLIDAGEIVTQDKGVVARRATDAALDEQRTGRVSRSTTGIVYKSMSAGTGQKPTPYPTHAEISRLGSLRTKLLQTLGITDRLSSVEAHGLEPSPVDPFMSVEQTGDRDIDAALAAWWLLSCQSADIRDADRAYDSIVSHGYTDADEHIQAVLYASYKTAWLVKREAITGLIASRPYTVIIDGVRAKALGLRYINEDVRWV